MPIIFVTQDKCLFQDTSTSELVPLITLDIVVITRWEKSEFYPSDTVNLKLRVFIWRFFSLCVHCSMLALSSLSTSSNCPVSIPSFVPSEKTRHNPSKYNSYSIKLETELFFQSFLASSP